MFQSNRASTVGAPNEEIYVMKADGSEQRRLTNHPGPDVDPDWSPDGRMIAFERASEPSKIDQVFVMSADGGQPAPLTTLPSANGHPGWDRGTAMRYLPAAVCNGPNVGCLHRPSHRTPGDAASTRIHLPQVPTKPHLFWTRRNQREALLEFHYGVVSSRVGDVLDFEGQLGIRQRGAVPVHSRQRGAVAVSEVKRKYAQFHASVRVEGVERSVIKRCPFGLHI